MIIMVHFIEISGEGFNPSKCTYEYETFDGENAGRTLDGTMHRDVIATKVSLQLEWNSIGVNEMKRLLNAMDKPFFEVEYFDPKKGDFISDRFYCGSRTVPVYSFVNGQVKYDSGFSVNLIQR